MEETVNKLELVRQIFQSEQFRKTPKDQQMKVIKEIVKTKEVTEGDVMKIYWQINASMLEKLPYDLFINFVVSTGIKGKDVRSLCNSSPILNGYCNREFILQNDDVIPEYLFKLLLERDRPDIKNVSGYFRDAYKHIVIRRDSDYNKLVHLLSRLNKISLGLIDSSVIDHVTEYPKILQNLLYDPDDNELGFLFDLTVDSSQSKFTQKDLEIFQDIRYLLQAVLDNVGRDYGTGVLYAAGDIWRQTQNPKKVLEFLNLSEIDLKKIMQTIRRDGRSINVSSVRLEPILEHVPSDYGLIYLLENFDDLFREILNVCMPIDHIALTDQIFYSLDSILQSYLDAINEDPVDLDEHYNIHLTSELYELLADIRRGAYTYVIDYLVQLHYKILSGKLNVTTLFDRNVFAKD
jgi:hypothetical protein